MSEEKRPRQKASAKKKKSEPIAPQKLKLLFVIADRKKGEYYTDLLQSFGVNMLFSLAGHGTATTEVLRTFNYLENEKTVVCGFIREEKAAEALSVLEEKFRTLRGGKGIAYTVPLTSLIGVAVYRFLTDNRMTSEEK